MKHRKCASLFIVLLIITSSFAQAPPLATPQQLQEMMDAKEYRLCLQQIARVLQVRGAAPQYDLPTLQLMRGECFLQLKDRQSAVIAYEQAAKSQQLEQAAEALAMKLLVTRSANFTYKSKSNPRAEASDIVDAASRKAALSQLLTDHIEGLQSAARQATASKSLKPTMAIVPRLIEVRALELVTATDDQEVASMIMPIGQHARTLIQDELEKIDQRIGQLKTLADQEITVGGGAGRRGRGFDGFTERRGLFSNERDELRGFARYLDDIGEAAVQGHTLARFWKGKPETWQPLVEASNAARRRAEDLLATE